MPGPSHNVTAPLTGRARRAMRPGPGKASALEHPSLLPAVSDQQAVERVLSGDVNAFEVLVTRYQGLVFSIVGRHLPPHAVEDTAQEVFVRAYQSLAKVREPERIKGWLSTIAVRACHDYWRARYRDRESPLSSLSEDSENWLESVTAQQSMEEQEEAGRRQDAVRTLEEALAILSPTDRMVLELVHLEERSTREAARLLGISAVNVRVRAHRARKRMRALLTSGVEKS